MKLKLFFIYAFEFLRDGYYVGLFLLLPFITKELHLNLFQVGTLSTLINILLVIGAIPTTFLLIRFGVIKLSLFSLTLYFLGFAGIFFIYSYTSLLLMFFFLGISFVFFSITSSHARLTWFSKETRGKELGNLMAAGDIAKVIFSVSISFLIGYIGWRITSIATGSISAITFLIFSYLLSQSNLLQAEFSIKNTSEHTSFRYFLQHKLFLSTLVTNMLDEGINGIMYAFLPFLLLAKHVPPLFLGVFTGFYYFGNICSRIIFGRLVDKIGHAKTLIALEIGMSLFIFLLVISPNLVITSIVALLLGFISEGTDPASSSMMAESVEHLEHPEKASGIKTVASGISKALFSFLMGTIANVLGITGAFYVLCLAILLPIFPAVIFIQLAKNHKS